MTTTTNIPTYGTTLADSVKASPHGGASSRIASAAVGAALSVGALLLAPSPADAKPPFALAPACDNYQFKGGLLQLEYGEVTVQIPATGQTVGPGEAFQAIIGKSVASFGNASGGVTGRNINITVNWTRGPAAGGTSTITGQVNDDGHASGAHTLTGKGQSDGTNPWHTSDTLSCYTPAPLPMPKLPPPTPPKDAISVNFANIVGGLRVNVNNSSSVNGTCTYDATAPNSFIPPFHKDFTIAPNGGASFDISGFATGTQYNTVTVCHGDYFGQDVQIGRVELTKRF
jgi:hypothetical protein